MRLPLAKMTFDSLDTYRLLPPIRRGSTTSNNVYSTARDGAKRPLQTVSILKEGEEPRSRLLTNSLPNGSRELLVPSRGSVSKVLIHPTKQSTFDAHRPLFHPQPSTNPLKPLAGSPTAKVGVNKEFFRQLAAIFKIIIPRAHSKEVFLIAAHTSFLLLRTYLSLLVARLDGKLVGDLVSNFFFREGRRSYWTDIKSRFRRMDLVSLVG